MIDKVPGQSKVYRGIERQQNLKEQLFLFLLQKREENAINLSVEVPKAKIVNPAFTEDTPVSPKKDIILPGALFLGLLIPFAIFYLLFLLDDKIYSREDIKERSALVSWWTSLHFQIQKTIWYRKTTFLSWRKPLEFLFPI